MAFNFLGFLRFAYLWLLRSPWTRRRALVAAAFLLFVPLELAIRCGWLLDRLLYPGYRRRPVEAPVFITGNPRSGTTFLHRLLAEDSERFSTMRMWQILFAPSIAQRRLAAVAGALERRFGAPCRRLLERIERSWDASMHRISLFAPEEDDYLLLHAWSALTAGLSAGLLDEARPYTYFDGALPARERRRIMQFYRRCIQRHLHAEALERGGAAGRLYLAKNPALCPKLDSVLEEFPDARIIYVVRNPLDVVPSYLHMLDFSWEAVGVAADRAALRDYVLEMAGHWYRYPLERLAALPPDRYVIVKYDDLTRDPEHTVGEIYARLGLSVEPRFAAILRRESAKARLYRSVHEYVLEELGLSRQRLVAEFRDVLDRFGFPTDGAVSPSRGVVNPSRGAVNPSGGAVSPVGGAVSRAGAANRGPAARAGSPRAVPTIRARKDRAASPSGSADRGFATPRAPRLHGQRAFDRLESPRR